MSFMPLDENLKEAFYQIQDGTAFDRSLETSVGAVEGHLGGVQTKVSTVPAQINGVASNIMDKARNIETQITSAANRIPTFAAHITKQFNNLPNNISTFASSQGLKNALAGKSGGCSNMKDFFGSITTDGPKLIGEINLLVDNVSAEIDRFKNLGSTLQGNITASYNEIITQLNAEIASAGADIARVTDLNAIKATVQANFQSAIADVRADLAAQVQSKLSAQRRALVDGVVRDMTVVDLNIQGAANKINGFAGEIDLKSLGLQSLIDRETTNFNNAVSELETLGQAGGMRSLFNSNPCVQSLMGFVGKTSFLKNLKGF